MYLAHVAALRSAALPRQVGAALTSADGGVIATGCNDAPRSGGGQYWEGDEDDKRDHVLGWDSSDVARADMVADVFERLRKKKWLASALEGLATDELVRRALSDGGPFKNSQLAGVVEFGRVIHAEMAALTDAARRGVSTQGATLYTTTFPCHNCARHIVSAGVSRVVYVEPYPKSRAIDLHQDAIALEPASQEQRVRFEPFVGIGARLYPVLFRMVRRKDAEGRAVVWHARGALPRMAMTRQRLNRHRSGAASAHRLATMAKHRTGADEPNGRVIGVRAEPLPYERLASSLSRAA
jgi:deoxycytidylate deaminase